MRRVTKLLFLIIMSTTISSFADSQHSHQPPTPGVVIDEKDCRDWGLGERWYCPKQKDASDTEDKLKPEFKTAEEILSSKIDPLKKAAELKKLQERQHIHLMVNTHNEQDILDFINTQTVIASLPVKIANEVRLVQQKYPLSEKEHSHWGGEMERALDEKENKKDLANLKERFVVALVYSSSCPHCHAQIPILLNLQKLYGFATIGVTESNSFLKGFDENVTDSEITKDPNVKAYPTTLLINKKTGERLFIARGLAVASTLEERILMRYREEVKNENHKK